MFFSLTCVSFFAAIMFPRVGQPPFFFTLTPTAVFELIFPLGVFHKCIGWLNVFPDPTPPLVGTHGDCLFPFYFFLFSIPLFSSRPPLLHGVVFVIQSDLTVVFLRPPFPPRLFFVRHPPVS